MIIFGRNALMVGFWGVFEKNSTPSTELDHTVECLTRALSLRDLETEEHARRVTALTLNLARAADVPPAELIHVRRGAMLHDFILRKDAPLTSTDKASKHGNFSPRAAWLWIGRQAMPMAIHSQIAIC